MTWRDFQLLADTLRESPHPSKSQTARAALAGDFADALASTNPRFDRARFVRAAQPRWTVGTRQANAWDRVAVHNARGDYWTDDE